MSNLSRRSKTSSRSPRAQRRGEDHEGPGTGDTEDSARLAAHEIRSHLTVLSGYLSMLEDGTLGRLPEPARSALSPMRAKTRAISRMVDDMLEDVRERDGRLHLARRSIDLGGVVREVADDARFDLSESHRLSVEIPAHPLVANIDPKRVATIVRNLIDNAIKYSPDGGAIQCRLEAVDGEARITVEDRGVGIDPADAEQLFDRYERGRAIDRGVDGVGLGLYIARTLARLHDGDISVRGRRGEGAEFTVRLPLAATSTT